MAMMDLGAITSFATYPSGSSYYALPAAGGFAHQKGSYAEITAATGFAANGAFFGIGNGYGGGRSFQVDFAAGAAGAEVILIGDWDVQNGDFWDSSFSHIHWPIAIAASTRLASRLQATVGGTQIETRASIYARDALLNTFTSVTQYGANSGITQPVQIDPGGIANTKGAYAQLTASTTTAGRGLVFRPSTPETFPTANNSKVDIATGAAGAETVRLADLFMQADIDDKLFPQSYEFGLAIAASTRIAVRSQCSITDPSDRLFWCQVHLYAGTGAPVAGVSPTVPTLLARAIAGAEFTFSTPAIDTSGATLLVAVTTIINSAPTPTLSDNKGNTWVAVPSSSGLAGQQRSQIFYAANPVVGAGHTVTMTSSGSTYGAISFLAFAGITTTSPLDQHNANGLLGTYTSLSTGPITTTQGNTLVVTGFSSGGNLTTRGQITLDVSGQFVQAGSLNTVSAVTYGLYAGFAIVTTPATVNPTWTAQGGSGINVNGTAVIASFTPAVASGGGGGSASGGSFVFAG